jgi:hypothetical protein
MDLEKVKNLLERRKGRLKPEGVMEIRLHGPDEAGEIREILHDITENRQTLVQEALRH